MPLDLIVVPIREGKKITGIGVHAGLWTSQALTAPTEEVPVLRRRLAALEKEFGFDPSGHSGKALRHALASLPRDLLVNLRPRGEATWRPRRCRLPTGRGPTLILSAASSRAICSPSSGCRATSSPPGAGSRSAR